MMSHLFQRKQWRGEGGKANEVVKVQGEENSASAFEGTRSHAQRYSHGWVRAPPRDMSSVTRHESEPDLDHDILSDTLSLLGLGTSWPSCSSVCLLFSPMPTGRVGTVRLCLRAGFAAQPPSAPQPGSRISLILRISDTYILEA